jgi:hypothetical protein
MTSKTVEVWIVMGEKGDYEVAPDEDRALERLIDGSSEDLAGTVCRIVQLNVTIERSQQARGGLAARRLALRAKGQGR